MRPVPLVHAARTIVPYLSTPSRWGLGALALIGLLVGALEAVLFTAVGALISLLDADSSTVAILVLGDVQATTLVAIGLAAAAAIVVLRICEAHLISQIGIEPMVGVQRRLVRGYLCASFTRQQSERAGQFQELLMSHARRVGFIAYSLAGAISSLAIITILSVAAATYHVGAFAGLAGVVVVLVLLLLPVQRLARRFGSQESSASLDYSMAIAETLDASREVRLFAIEDARIGELDSHTDRVGHAIYKMKMVSMTSPALYRSLVLAVLVTGLGIMTAGDFDDRAAVSTVALLMIRALMETQVVHSYGTLISEYIPFLDETDEWLKRYRDDEVARGDRQLASVASIEISDLSYAYSSTSPRVLDGVSLSIAGGEKLGIVGPSGVGKSTLVAIVAGLLDPHEGTVTVNGHAPSEFAPSSWSRQVAMVPQTPVLLTTSAFENIRFFRDDITDAQIRVAAKAAGIGSEIESWPQGYDTVIGDRGARALSGGQRQRICIARALAGQPSLLLMDEPTSSLDRAAEDVITQTIEALGSECGVIVVSHRESALRSCDRIVRFESGVGSPSEVIQN